ncbi:MAG: hypothetical protein LBG29_00140 [Synergistaceae bacterium]|jgi:hypothetical protein|nr:hypothetical protein [Synergistaceae bacterium]
MKYIEKHIVTQSVGETQESHESSIEIGGIPLESESIPCWLKERIEGQGKPLHLEN